MLDFQSLWYVPLYKSLGQWVFVFEIYTFIKQGCIKLIKSDSEDK